MTFLRLEIKSIIYVAVWIIVYLDHRQHNR